MNQNRIIGIALALLNVILLLFCIVRYVQSDRIPPRFLLEATDIIYVPDINPAELIQGISANDDRDGDVSDRIVIEKITEKKKEETAVVYYAVSDRSGNVAKLSKLFHAEYPELQDDAQQDTTELQNMVTGQGAYDQESEEKTEPDGENESDTISEEPDDSEENTDEQKDKEEETLDVADPQVEAPEQEEAEQPEEPVETDHNNGAPELVLGSSEITIDAGTNPPWTEIITTMRDDKDNYETLYYNLHVSQYNRNRPGTYSVTVYVEDSDGNQSQEIPFTIIVR